MATQAIIPAPTGNPLRGCEFTVERLRNGLSSCYSLFFGREKLPFPTVILSYISRPFVDSWPKLNPCKSAGVCPSSPTIAGILRRRGLADVIASIIQSIVVDVIHYFPIPHRKAEDKSVHLNSLLPFDSNSYVSASIKALRALVEICVPFPLIEPLVIGCINFRKLILSERNETVFWNRAGSLLNQVHGMPLQRQNNLSQSYQIRGAL